MGIFPPPRHSPFAGGTPTLLDEKSRPFRIGFEMISVMNKEHRRPACAEPIPTQEAHPQSTKHLTSKETSSPISRSTNSSEIVNCEAYPRSMSISPLQRHSPFAGGTPTLLDKKSRPFRIDFEIISVMNKEHGRPACAEPIPTQEAHPQSTKHLTSKEASSPISRSTNSSEIVNCEASPRSMSISPLQRHSPFAGGTPTLLDKKSRPFRIDFEIISVMNKEHGRPACAEPIPTQEPHPQSIKHLTSKEPSPPHSVQLT